MPKDTHMSDKHHNATYHDAHLDDAAEWDDTSAEDVTPQPSAMTVFSLRLPRDEFRLVKQEADRRNMTMSELTRTALRFYLMPRATGSLSATAIHHLQVTSYIPVWTGGIADPAQVQHKQVAPLGNVVPA